MIFGRLNLAAIMAVSFALAGCTSLSVFKDNQEAAATPAPQPAPVAPPPAAKVAAVEPPPAAAPLAPETPSLTSSQIRTAVSGKTFKWTGPNNSGTTLFSQDGKTMIEVDGKGVAEGTWVARDGQLCETVKPGKILPKGSALTCKQFTRGRGNYKVGPVTFNPA